MTIGDAVLGDGVVVVVLVVVAAAAEPKMLSRCSTFPQPLRNKYFQLSGMTAANF